MCVCSNIFMFIKTIYLKLSETFCNHQTHPIPMLLVGTNGRHGTGLQPADQGAATVGLERTHQQFSHMQILSESKY